MNEFILAEVNFFLASFLFGVLLFLAYDILVILRNIIHHAKFVMAIEDIGFWITAGILIFCMMYLMNDGTIRYYAVISVILGMKLYQVFLGKHVVHIGSLFGNWIKNLLKKFFHFITTPLRLLYKQLKKSARFLANIIGKRAKFILHFLRKQLKIRAEKVKMKKRMKQEQKELEVKEPEKIRGVLELVTLSDEKGELYEAMEEKEKKRT
jgi:spore cortex biosynthesis protein YabQ